MKTSRRIPVETGSLVKFSGSSQCIYSIFLFGFLSSFFLISPVFFQYFSESGQLSGLQVGFQRDFTESFRFHPGLAKTFKRSPIFSMSSKIFGNLARSFWLQLDLWVSWRHFQQSREKFGVGIFIIPEDLSESRHLFSQSAARDRPRESYIR